MDGLSDAQILLLAAQLAATPDLPKLHHLAATHRDMLTNPILYRILLTYLPADVNVDEEVATEFVSLLEDLDNSFENHSLLDSFHGDDFAGAYDIASAEALLASLRLEKVPLYDEKSEQDGLSDFLIAWVRKVEEFSGLSTTSLTFIERFVSRHKVLDHWMKTYVKPLFLLQNEFYAEQATSLSLHDMETIHGQSGITTLLQFSETSADLSDVGRDLKRVVTPWVRGAKVAKRRKLSTPEGSNYVEKAADWHNVNEWIFNTSRSNFALSAAAVESWDGPSSSEITAQETEPHEAFHNDAVGYVRTVFALIYTPAREEDENKIRKKKRLLRRAANLAQLMPPDDTIDLPNVPDVSVMYNVTRADLFENELLSAQNSLTQPSSDVVDFLSGILATQGLLSSLKIKSSTQSVTCTTLFDSEEKQKSELRSILNQVPRLTTSNLNWSDIRSHLQWLRSWSHAGFSARNTSRIAYLGRVPEEYLESAILDAILAAGDFQVVKDIYLKSGQQVLSDIEIKEHIISTIFNAYDNSSNGNRTRGGIKKAADTIAAFKPNFPDTTDFDDLEHLIKATHSLSFYQLTLQHGIPFRPVSIRASSDPLSLVEKVLDQNNKAYAKLDDLLAIARNLVLARLHNPTSPDFAPGEVIPIYRQLADAEHRITYSAIEAALADHDFDTAYSLITTRLSISPSCGQHTLAVDDTSWRAAFAAGKYRPASSPTDIHKQIASLQKRMELLSTALLLAPNPDPLPEILNTWRRCEEELDSLKSQALEEERAFDAQMEGVLPGAFEPDERMLDANETQRLLGSRRAYNATGPSYEDEAPIGLFDVARGAASALRKNAFPLVGAQGSNMTVKGATPRQSLEGSLRSSGEFERPGSADGQRVRKRDMLSNAVSGGFVSGMSWVLGAQPPPKQ